MHAAIDAASPHSAREIEKASRFSRQGKMGMNATRANVSKTRITNMIILDNKKRASNFVWVSTRKYSVNPYPSQ